MQNFVVDSESIGVWFEEVPLSCIGVVAGLIAEDRDVHLGVVDEWPLLNHVYAM